MPVSIDINKMSRVLTLSYPEHFCTTAWARTLRCWFPILHGYAFGILHLSFSAAFYTIGLHLYPSFRGYDLV